MLEFGSLFSAGTALLYIYITNAYHRRIPDFALGVSKTFGEGVCEKFKREVSNGGRSTAEQAAAGVRRHSCEGG